MESPAAQVPLKTKTPKVSVNPFRHMVTGTRNLLQTNPVETLAVIVLQIVVSVAMTFLAVILLASSLSGIFVDLYGSSINNPLNSIGNILAFGIVAGLVWGYFTLVYNRVILSGSRRQKESLGDTFKLALRRMPQAILLLLFILLVLFGAGIVMGLFSAASPVLGIFLGIVLIVAGIIFFLRICYTQFVLVDDNEPQGVMKVIKESALYWKRSDWALILYFTTIFVLYIVFSLIVLAPLSKSRSDLSYSTNYNYSSSSSFRSNDDFYNQLQKELRPSAMETVSNEIVGTILSTVLSVIVLCGVANIYNEARGLGDASGTIGVPTPPISGGPVPPTSVSPTPPVAA